MAKHDENKDLKSLSKIAKINYGDKTIQCPKNTNMGIRRLGKIDFLTKYCGWSFIWNNAVTPGETVTEDKKSFRDIEKAKKAPKLSNKKK